MSAKNDIRAVVADLAEGGVTVFLTTHYMEEADQLCDRVAIIDHLPDGEPSRREVASELAMSERTLARRLSDREYTFSGLVDEVRGQLAKEYLRQSRFSVTDVAFLLGFSDQSNFARAFKRWTDESPTEFRSRALD